MSDPGYIAKRVADDEGCPPGWRMFLVMDGKPHVLHGSIPEKSLPGVLARVMDHSRFYRRIVVNRDVPRASEGGEVEWLDHPHDRCSVWVADDEANWDTANAVPVKSGSRRSRPPDGR